jgi:UDP-N-acetylmuramate dehydrogenase
MSNYMPVADINHRILVRSNISGKSLTHFKIGGTCARVVQISDIETLAEFLDSLQRRGETWRIIGAGSNLLIDDPGVDECIIQLHGTFEHSRELSPGYWEVGAGVGLMRLSRRLTEMGYSGLEFAAGIPGTMGGGIVMNAGAHGKELSSIVQSVKALTGNGELKVFSRDELSFSYRHSIFSGSDSVNLESNRRLIVLSAILKLTVGESDELMKVRGECLAYRKLTQPLTEPSAGSIFTNPSGELSAGRLIEECGLKGRVIGGAEISSKHANWIVNRSRSATASDVRALIQLCQEEVEKKFSMRIRPEIRIWQVSR